MNKKGHHNIWVLKRIKPSITMTLYELKGISMDTIFVLISFVENENMKKCLLYLVEAHEEVIIDMDIRITGLKRQDTIEFKPWLIIENNTRGIYLVNKIREKFEPWVAFWKQTPLYPHNIPSEIKGVAKWNPTVKKMKLKIL